MLTKKITSKKVNNETRKIVCGHCNVKTNHKVHASVEFFWDETDIAVQGYDLYEIVSCLGCDTLSFRLASTNSEDVEIDEKGNYSYPEIEEIYPSRLIGRPPLKEQYSLPEKIRVIYKETHAALSSKLKILAGVGIRALVESICSEEKAVGSNLKERIDDLVKKNVLTPKNAETLHKTRFLGNRSAHEVESATDSELEVAFDILENLLETVYIIPQKAKGLKN